MACTAPKLPTPEPPYCPASVLSTSSHTTARSVSHGNGSEYPSHGTPAKFATQTSGVPSLDHRTNANTL